MFLVQVSEPFDCLHQGRIDIADLDGIQLATGQRYIVDEKSLETMFLQKVDLDDKGVDEELNTFLSKNISNCN